MATLMHNLMGKNMWKQNIFLIYLFFPVGVTCGNEMRKP
jgi:hypothetical protein